MIDLIKEKIGLILFLLVMIIPFSILSVEHPHIVVNENLYQSLIEKSVTWPWSTMKLNAIAEASKSSVKVQANHVAEYAGALSLSFILDTTAQLTYIRHAEEVLAPVLEKIKNQALNTTGHGGSVTPSYAAFMVYIMLDVLYNHLDVTIRTSMENACDAIANHHENSWKASKYAILGMKELYHHGKSATFEDYKDLYKDYILSLTSEDGVYSTGPGYAISRLFMDSRLQKKSFMDICEFQGYHEFYNHPKLQNLYEWVFGYTMTPFNRSYTFGDSPPTKALDHWSVAALRSTRFSQKAQHYASWFLGPLTDVNMPSSILHYVFCDTIPLEAKQPESRIFSKGGAWLIEASESPNAMAGVLWINFTEASSHKHMDGNAIHIAAYGEHILRNSGYDGYGQPDPDKWEWIRKTAESSNTLMISGRNHIGPNGDGIVKSLLNEKLDYAVGKMTSSLAIASHNRHFIFIKPVQSINHGYFLLLEDVQTFFWTGSDPAIQIALHPNSNEMPVVFEDSTEFQWGITGCNYSGHDVKVSICLGTEPESIQIKDGYLGSYESCSRMTGKYLYSTYPAKENDHTFILTGIFPFDANHPKPEIKRILRINASGLQIDHGNQIVDYALTNHDTTSILVDAVNLKGVGGFWRKKNDHLFSYLIVAGNCFLDSSTKTIGYKSDQALTIYMDNKSGQVVSSGTDITFYYPQIKSVELNNQAVNPIESDEGWIKVSVPEGTHQVQLISPYLTPVISEKNGTLARDFLCSNSPNPFNAQTQISYTIPKDGLVKIVIYNSQGQKVEQLLNEYQSLGEYTLFWEPDTHYSSGLYFCRIEHNSMNQVLKVLYQK